MNVKNCPHVAHGAITQFDIVSCKFAILPYSDMFALIQSKNHASNKGKTVGGYQFDTCLTGIGLNIVAQGEV